MILEAAIAFSLLLALAGSATVGYRLGQQHERKRGDRRAVDSFARGLVLGEQAGADRLANAYLEAAGSAEDPLDAWPRARRTEARPS